MQSTKNLALSPAATDLGLGDMLSAQTEDIELERKRKLLKQYSGLPSAYGDTAISPASMMLLGKTGGYS